MQNLIFDTKNISIDPINYITNLLIGFILSIILTFIYNKFSNSLSDKKIFSNNFTLITTTTILVITVVKSSLALSLGLVGALSIVRFRTPIKDPEELAYIFLCIAIGLALGANYQLITIISFLVIIIFVIIQNQFFKNQVNKEMYCTISLEGKLALEEILKIVKNHTNYIFLRDFDINDEMSSIGLIINFNSEIQMNELVTELENKHKGVNIKFINKYSLS